MPWSYKINSTLAIAEVTYSGEITGHDLRQSTSALIALEKKEDESVNRFLVDTKGMKISASLAGIFDIPLKQYEEEEADRQGRVPVMLSTSAKEKEFAKFYQIMCQSSGWKVQTFTDQQAAMDWLTGKKA